MKYAACADSRKAFCGSGQKRRIHQECIHYFFIWEVFPLITFLLALAALITGYFIYGRIVDHFFGPDDRQTPATIHNDGVDYIPLPTWKVFLIQLLNIAGLGPIFGALGGAL